MADKAAHLTTSETWTATGRSLEIWDNAPSHRPAPLTDAPLHARVNGSHSRGGTSALVPSKTYSATRFRLPPSALPRLPSRTGSFELMLDFPRGFRGWCMIPFLDTYK